VRCTMCERDWPDEFRVCPICGLPLRPEAQAEAAGKVDKAAGSVGAGAVAAHQVSAPVATQDSIAAGGHVVVASGGSTVVIGEPPVDLRAVDRDSALAAYLRHVIQRNRYLQLQGIRSGGRLVHIELEQIYVTLRATRQRSVQAEEAWLAEQAGLAPGEGKRRPERLTEQTETVSVSVNEALAAHNHLVVLGDPGSGKSTLLSYLAQLYARDLAEGSRLVQQRLGLEEAGRLPVLLPLRRLGAYLAAHRAVEDGTEGHALLLQHLLAMLQGERLALPADFFDAYLQAGNAVLLLDGLDEVADPELRRRVARLVEAFSAAYPQCRYVVTSRIVGYSGAARLGEGYATTTIRDFTLEDVRTFLHNWHLAVAVGQMGPGESAAAYAEAQTQQLLHAIQQDERIRELAINPLMLTVIALVHRDRVKLPDRRAELYDEAVGVLLGKWQEARGVQELPILEERPFDAGDKRLLLQAVALWMHERQQKEIEALDLRRLLGDAFYAMLGNWRAASRAVERFLCVIQERTGLLGEHGSGVYRFSHLTFQEYLAALAVAGRDDYVEYTLQRAGQPWWRETILLEAGHLSTHSRERTTRLIQAIAACKDEPEPYYNLVLAAECLRDVGVGRVAGDLLAEVQKRLRQELETPPPKGRLGPLQVWVRRGMTVQDLAHRRAAAGQALARIEATPYWSLPHGEPEWVEIPGGEFWMGSEKSQWEDERPVHRVRLESFLIARVPVTNAQYRLFVQAAGHEAPDGWEAGRPPKDKQSHPVVNVSWHDALAYCEWLGRVSGKRITLPSEAEWEKAARGDRDQREYPWGDAFEAARCNCGDLGLLDTTPVGIFPAGASPYGVLDMAGNVWEWTRSLWGEDPGKPEFAYPYDPRDGRENLERGEDVLRVLRGGSYNLGADLLRCAFRFRSHPNLHGYIGFRVVASPILL